MHVLSALFLFSMAIAAAYELPANLENIYKSHKTGECKNILASGFSTGSSGNDVSYCGDIDGAIFLHGSSDGGVYADMDVDCDGADNGARGCSNDPSGQGTTAFKDKVSKYGISDLNANVHPYVVFGNEGASPSFEPKDHGMEPLSVMAVVCGGKLHYGIWGDTNGEASTGEASISMAKLCFPDGEINGDNGHGEKDVLYIGFTGKKAAPGSKADWTAKDSKSFEASIKSLGDQLVARLGSTSSTSAASSGPSGVSIPSSIAYTPITRSTLSYSRIPSSTFDTSVPTSTPIFTSSAVPSSSYPISTLTPSFSFSAPTSTPTWKPRYFRN